MSNMKALLLLQTRIVYAENAFADLVLWQLPQPLVGSAHPFKYRLAFVGNGMCVLRYDNESGEGDHRHCGCAETAYAYTTPEALIADFQNDIERWNHENRHS